MLSTEKGRITATAKGTSSLLCIAGTLLALTANVLLAAYTDKVILFPRDMIDLIAVLTATLLIDTIAAVLLYLTRFFFYI